MPRGRTRWHNYIWPLHTNKMLSAQGDSGGDSQVVSLLSTAQDQTLLASSLELFIFSGLRNADQHLKILIKDIGCVHTKHLKDPLTRILGTVVPSLKCYNSQYP